ncbi:MAG: hypothetical protein ACR2HM_07205 [Acidimicrobiales bacterium]
MRVIRGLLTATGLAGAAATAGWFVLAKAQGDSEMGYGPSTIMGTAEGAVHAEVELVNRGREAGVVRKVEGTLVEGPPGRVLVTRKDSQPPQRGWWVSNILKPGETCTAEIDVELAGRAQGPVIVALDMHEIGRRLVVHRRTRLTLPIGVPSHTS